MKTKILITSLTLISIFLDGILAQSTKVSDSFFSKPKESPMFGKDIIIDNQPSQNQRNTAICSAFNGWLYAISAPYDSTDHLTYFYLLKSADSGISWNIIYSSYYSGLYVKMYAIDLVAIGDSISNLKIIVTGIRSVPSSDYGSAFAYRFNGETGDYELTVMSDDGVFDLALASDYNYPALNSDPSSIGILYSKHKNNKDSIIFTYSSDGGISFNNKQTVSTSATTFFKNVSLNYGRSPSFPSGRYFGAWEERASQTSNKGHIYTSHSEPNFNSTFTNPFCLDSLDPSTINNVRNPSIACQFNNNDNGSGNFTELVIFEKYVQSGNSFNLGGFYNLQAIGTNNFTLFSISNSPNNQLQPNVNFNPYNSTFMLTYFDSTELKLPFLINDVNLNDPNLWNIINPAYNDENNLITPNPIVKINYEKQSGMNTWISEGSFGNGVALFDASYSTWTGISETISVSGSGLVYCYPNPCSDYLNIGFALNHSGTVTIKIMDLAGRNLAIVTDQFYSQGNHKVNFATKQLVEGTYLFDFTSRDQTTSGKFLIVK